MVLISLNSVMLQQQVLFQVARPTSMEKQHAQLNLVLCLMVVVLWVLMLIASILLQLI
jgi:hypothetical protein